MKKLIFINACIRGEASRTLRLATPLIAELSKRYEITEIDLTDAQALPVNSGIYETRSTLGASAEDIDMAKAVANADRIVIAAPFWDMGIPAVLKTFIERISLSGITFSSNEDKSTRGNCKAEKLLYITTRGMEIETGSPLEQGSSYLKAIAWLWGIGKVETVAVSGTDTSSPEIIEERLADAIEKGISLCKEF